MNITTEPLVPGRTSQSGTSALGAQSSLQISVLCLNLAQKPKLQSGKRESLWKMEPSLAMVGQAAGSGLPSSPSNHVKSPFKPVPLTEV